MLTQKDLKRKSFKSNELTKINLPVFDRNFNVNFPDNFETILHLLKQIQFRKAARSNQINVELENLDHNCTEDHVLALKTELSALEHHRRTIHTIYTQIVSYLFFSTRGTPLYVQSPANAPELRNLIVLQFGDYRHRVQLSKKDIAQQDIEYRGEYVKPEPSSLVYLSKDQIEEFGYQEMDIIRICRRISNYIIAVRRKFNERLSAIHEHNFISSQINKLIKTGEVTIDKKTEKTPAAVNEKTPKQKIDESRPDVKAKDSPKARKIGIKRNLKADAVAPEKKPINIIRKRTFVLQK